MSDLSAEITVTLNPAVQGLPALHLPELLAPAGDWECARAAVENGADAIYFGLEKFNARIRANNFTVTDLPELMAFLHRRGVKGYVTFNTLIFENELAEATEHLRAIIAGVDAAIVQDVGICRLIRSLSPDFPIHASTQMTITTAAGVAFARELGCNLVVLARECSIAEIEKIRSSQSSVSSIQASNSASLKTENCSLSTGSLPLEVFVHGALCVAYSGQCLTSESLGGRSANRGECAQACRMPYELISDGNLVPLGDRKYLLSPQDLAGLDVLPELARSGVASLKIEGRLKSPEYVANITRIYRRALDELRPATAAKNDLQVERANALILPAATLSPSDGERDGVRGHFEIPSDKLSHHEVSANAESAFSSNRQYEMEMAFSRGLHTGWLGGIDNQRLVHARFGKKRGVYLGEVKRVSRDAVEIKLQAPLKRGDGVVFDAGKPEEREEGGRVYAIRVLKSGSQNEVELQFGKGDVNFLRVRVGDKLWKTDDPELNRRLRQTFEGDTPKFQRGVTMEVHGMAGKPLTLIVRDEMGHVTKVQSTMPLDRAEKQPLTTDKLREQLGRLGGTPFRLETLRNELPENLILPLSELNRLRREAVADLERQRAQPKKWKLHATSQPRVFPRETYKVAAAPELIVLVRNLSQLDAALQCGTRILYCDFENPKKYRDAVRKFHESFGCSDSDGERARPTIWVAPPRIFKTGEEWTLDQVRSCNADGYLIRNYDHLRYFSADRRIGDFSLNIANSISADYFRNKFGLERLTASYDLNFEQLEALLQSAPPEWFEITIHQHMPMFHMEHCVFCAFLSSGKDYRDCGRPCDKHEVKLRDRVGAEHPLKADAGCRNTVFNALAQTGAEYVERMLALGVRHFRIEFLNENPDEVIRTITRYRQLLRGEISGTHLWRDLKLRHQLGVTRGQIARKETGAR